MADVRVGIVSWNTASLLDRCLAALPAALHGLDAEIVVVDNASRDDSAEVAGRHGVQVRRNPENLGYARAMNQALEGSDAPALVALNPDTEPPPRALQRLVASLDAHPEAGLVVPRLRNADGSLQHSVYRFPSLAVASAVCLLPQQWHGGKLGRRLWLEGHAPHDRSGPVDWAIGAVHCIRAAALDSPPYDERWFMYVEDLDLCWRLHQRGWSVWFEADVDVPHVGNASGVQAWGDDRTPRWLDATYDWYEAVRGRGATRAWAAVNTFGMVAKLGWARVGLALGLPDRPAREAWAAESKRWAALHSRKLLHPTAALARPREVG